MATTSGKQYSVGLRHARLYALDERGIIAATSTTVYEGVQIPAAKALELTIPDVRRISHTGDDRILAQDILPRIEASSGVLRVGRNDHDVFALVTGTEARVIGELSKIGYATDQQGNEPDIGLLTFQQAIDAVARTRRYRGYAFASVRAMPVPGSMNENPVEFTFNLVPQVSTKALWGEQYTIADDGYTEAEFDELATVGYPHIVAWQGNGVATTFNFHADRPAMSVDKIAGVWTATTSASYATLDATATVTVTGVTPTTLPADGTIIICVYEYEP